MTQSLNCGPEALPFFAEYAYYLWGEINYDSDGDCKKPTDRAWTSLVLTNRNTRERLSIEVSPRREVVIEGPSAVEAAALTAIRTGATPRLPDDHAMRITRADRSRTQFLDPNLAAFDSHGWWGGWKWVGDFSTDFTSGLRVVMQSVHERRLVDPGLLDFLRSWQAEPPLEFHEVGVAFAIEFLGKLAK